MQACDGDIECIEIDTSSRKISLPSPFSWGTSECNGYYCSKIQGSISYDHSIAYPKEFIAMTSCDKDMSKLQEYCCFCQKKSNTVEDC